MPPSTAAVNALMPRRKPMLNVVRLEVDQKRKPATPAMRPPSRNVSITTRSMLTPISRPSRRPGRRPGCRGRGGCGSRRVEHDHHDERRDEHEHLVGADVGAEEGEQRVLSRASRGNGLEVAAGGGGRTTPGGQNDTPMAEIRKARRGALRCAAAGRPRARARPRRRRGHASGEADQQTTTRSGRSGTELSAELDAQPLVAKSAANMPSMKISEWAKLIRRRTP